METFDNFKPNKKETTNELEEIRDVFSAFKNAGIPEKTWSELTIALEENSLSDNYEEALEKSKPTEFFVANPDNEEEYMPYLKYVYDHFQEDILHLALISDVHLRTTEVNLQAPKDNLPSLEEGEYYIPFEVFKKSWEKLNEEQKTSLRKYIYRGESFSNWYMEGHTQGKFFPSPIILFNQDFDDKNYAIKNGKDIKELGLEYLEDLPKEERQLAYIRGSLGHEIAHNIFVYMIFNTELEDEWKKIIDEVGNISAYAKHWEERNSKVNYNENFAEAVRIYTTNCKYLQNRSLTKVIEFIENNFPEIKKD